MVRIRRGCGTGLELGLGDLVKMSDQFIRGGQDVVRCIVSNNHLVLCLTVGRQQNCATPTQLWHDRQHSQYDRGQVGAKETTRPPDVCRMVVMFCVFRHHP